LAGSALPSGAAAQSSQPAPVVASPEAAAAASAEAPPADPTNYAPVEPPPPPAPVVVEEKKDEKPLFRFYGIVKPTLVVGNALESFGNNNYIAPTAASNPMSLHNPKSVLFSFQGQQTRIGVAIGEGLPVSGKLEFDFVDSAFQKSSPAQATTIRVRQAFIDWTPKEGHKLTIGQLWDIFSPLNTHTYNLVGNNFQAGNVGFMRQQLIYSYTKNGLELMGALGLVNQNTTATFTNTEYNRYPTLALRGGYKSGKNWFGASAIATKIRFASTLPTEYTRIAVAGNVFGDVTFGSLNLRAEAYVGQNLNNLGSLALGSANGKKDVAELGGWVSAKYTAAEVHAFYAIVGGAKVLNDDNLAIAYSINPMPAAGASPFTRAGVGIRRNVVLHVGYAYTAYKGLQLIFEPGLFLTKHKLNPTDITSDTKESRLGWSVESGAMYTF